MQPAMDFPRPQAGNSRRSKPGFGYFRLVAAVYLFFSLALSCYAKEPLVAIVVFDSANGPGYMQVAAVTINGKTDLRSCDGVARINKQAYDFLPKVSLKAAATLQRGADGVLTLSEVDAAPTCVVPDNMKFERNAVFTPAQAADQAIIQGTVTPPSEQVVEIPAFKPGVLLYFVPAPDVELAEFLRAQRANSLAGWQAYLDRYASSSHAGLAKQGMAVLLMQMAKTALAEYGQTAAAHAPQFELLKHAQNHAEKMRELLGPNPATQKLLQAVHEQIDVALATSRQELQLYQKALAQRSSGLAHLIAAARLSKPALAVDPGYPPAAALHREVAAEESTLEAALESAENLLRARRYDDALNALGPYRDVAPEMPRIASVVNEVYTFHFTRGQEFNAQQNWEQAAAAFRSAVWANPDSKEADAALKNAELQVGNAANRRAVDQALAASKSYAQKGDSVAAYETLSNLPDNQRALVTPQMESLKKDYVVAAKARAQKLQDIHLPIRGRADEDAVRQACDLLQRVSSMTGDPAARLKLDLLSDKISAYYVDQARRYLQKPSGSGVGLGWLYLSEAQRYKSNLDSVRDEMARNQAAYQLRGRLSVGVIVRDQTSRLEGVGFADQLGDALANGLETANIQVKVVRHYVEDPAGVQPYFVLTGEILQHRVVKNTNLETLPSKYRAGTHEVKNEAWLNATQSLAAAQQELAQAQRTLTDAQETHKKKEVVAAATEAVSAAQAKIDGLRKQLDKMEETRPEAVLEPYNYTKKTIDLNPVIELSYRITDSLGNLVEAATPVRKENHKTYVVLENVKPEDAEGIKQLNTEPDDAQILTDLELQARDLLVKSVQEKVQRLPGRMLEQARQRAQQQDAEGAAEGYILYLNSTPDIASPERTEAAAYLRDHFNLAVAKNASRP